MLPIKIELNNGEILHGHLLSTPSEQNNLNWQIVVGTYNGPQAKEVLVRDEEVLEADVLLK